MGELVAAALARLRDNRREVFDDLLKYPDSWLDGTATFGFGDARVRWTILNFADHDEEHAIQLRHTLRSALGHSPTKAQILLTACEETRGDLLAALVGLTDDDLDIAPATPEGEWTLRQTLSHIIFVEHAYRIDSLHAVEQQAAEEPVVELPDIDLPHLYPDASLVELLAMLDTARDQNLRELRMITDKQLQAPTIWDPVEVDVNFLILRLAHHEREHTAHIRKWRVQTGKHQSEFERLLGLAWVTHGRLRGLLTGVDDDLFQKDPGNDEWSPAQIVAHLYDAEHVLKRRIDAASMEPRRTEEAIP